MSPALLTLDLSSRLGWTLGPPEASTFRFGSFQLPSTGADIGAFAMAFDQWISKMLDGHVNYVVFEAPILPKETQIATVRKLHGLCWHTEYVCSVCRIKCEEANVMEIRAFLGSGRMKKEDVIAAVERYGFAPQNHDEADAIAVRLFVLSKQFPDASKRLKLDLGALGGVSKMKPAPVDEEPPA